LFPPKPSVKPSLIFFGPHHDGLPAEELADDVAATTRAAVHASARLRSAPPLFLLILLCLPSLLAGEWFSDRATTGSCRGDARHAPGRETARERSPVDGVERDADAEGRCLDERSGRVCHAEREHELVELRQEERGDRRGDEVAATAEQRRTAEDDGSDRRQQVVVALVRGRL